MRIFLLLLCLAILPGARIFNGTSDSLVSVATVDLSGVNKMCVSFWIKEAADTDVRVIVELTENHNNYTTGFIVYRDTELGLGATGDTGLTRVTAPKPSTGVWTHVALNLDKSRPTDEMGNIFLNGVPQSLTTLDNADNGGNFGNHTLYVGSRGAASNWWNGEIAELAIWPGVTCLTNQAAALARGVRAFDLMPTTVPYYWDLRGIFSPEPATTNKAVNMTVNGATRTNHPPIRPFTK